MVRFVIVRLVIKVPKSHNVSVKRVFQNLLKLLKFERAKIENRNVKQVGVLSKAESPAEK